MKTVIFACVHNAGRSQMAAAFFNQLADSASAHAVSAGTNPGDRVHPEVIAVMRESGIDLSAAVPRKLTSELAAGAEMLITMGCGDECPFIKAKHHEDWNIPDPRNMEDDDFRKVRDLIEEKVKALLEKI